MKSQHLRSLIFAHEQAKKSCSWQKIAWPAAVHLETLVAEFCSLQGPRSTPQTRPTPYKVADTVSSASCLREVIRVKKLPSYHELRRYHTRPLRLNWGPKNVHFGKTHFGDPNIKPGATLLCFEFSTTVPKNGPKNSPKF